MTNSSDVVVVGAGVMGAAISYELARLGLSVTVVDKGSGVGQGSTSASSAVVRFHYSTFDGVAAAWESMHYWSAWSDHVGAGRNEPLASLQRTGVVMLDAPIAPRERSMDLFRAVGVPFEEWSPDVLRAEVPGIDPGRFWPPKRLDDEAFWSDPDGELGALFTADGGFVDDPLLATQNLAEAARRHGVRFRFKETVTEIRQVGSKVAGVALAGGDRIDSPVVVNCAGPWSRCLNALAGVGDEFTVNVRPMRQEVHVVDAPPGYNPAGRLGPMISDPDLGTYLRAAPGNSMLVGGSEPECDPLEWIEDADEYNPNRTVDVFEAQVTRAARRFPELRIPNRPSGIAGVYDVTPDWSPIYDRTDLDGYYVAIGTSGNQFKNAPLVGRIMASLITEVEGGRDHDLDPLPYKCDLTSHTLDLSAFSRKREINPYSSGTVMG
jgi:glycine/D-amino acid oxidase-like deaminating enzyme